MTQHVLMHKESGSIYLGVKINYHTDMIDISIHSKADTIYSLHQMRNKYDAWIILEPISQIWVHCNRDSVEKDYLEIGEL